MPACRGFRELTDSIFFTFKTHKDAACKCGNFREAISYIHLARFASSVPHTSPQMSLFFPWFPILSQFHFFLWIIYQLIIKLFCFLCCTLAPQPDLKQFQMVRITRISLKHITPDVILRNLIKPPTTCLVSHWLLSDVEKSKPWKLRPRKHWSRKCSLCITRKALRLLVLLLCKQFWFMPAMIIFILARALRQNVNDDKLTKSKPTLQAPHLRVEKSISFKLCSGIYLFLKVIETTLVFVNIAKYFFSTRKSLQRSNAGFLLTPNIKTGTNCRARLLTKFEFEGFFLLRIFR